MRMVLDISRLAEFDESQETTLLNDTLRLMLNEDIKIPPPVLASRVYDIATTLVDMGEVFDPYCELKEFSNRTALANIEGLRKIATGEQSPVFGGIKVAAAGNIIDFGAHDHRTIDIAKEIDGIEHLEFGIDHSDLLINHLERASNLLYLGDNAGEIVFDLVFLEILKKEYPKLDIVYAVRDRPILNDVTIKDAYDCGIHEVASVISSGSPHPGTVLEDTSSQFRDLYSTVDLVISKGQGNFETVSEFADERVFYIFRVKCDQVANISGAELGRLVIMNATE